MTDSISVRHICKLNQSHFNMSFISNASKRPDKYNYIASPLKMTIKSLSVSPGRRERPGEARLHPPRSVITNLQAQARPRQFGCQKRARACVRGGSGAALQAQTCGWSGRRSQTSRGAACAVTHFSYLSAGLPAEISISLRGDARSGCHAPPSSHPAGADQDG